MKTIENKGFLTTPNAMGRSVSVKTPANFKIPNEINGFVHDSYGTALKAFEEYIETKLGSLEPRSEIKTHASHRI